MHIYIYIYIYTCCRWPLSPCFMAHTHLHTRAHTHAHTRHKHENEHTLVLICVGRLGVQACKPNRLGLVLFLIPGPVTTPGLIHMNLTCTHDTRMHL